MLLFDSPDLVRGRHQPAINSHFNGAALLSNAKSKYGACNNNFAFFPLLLVAEWSLNRPEAKSGADTEIATTGTGAVVGAAAVVETATSKSILKLSPHTRRF